MSYQVLARKYRPANFQELEGQEHVLQALVNALDRDRLHHAYLFTGTRGVGKTTIARIFAKCLNCEAGVTSSPCGQCASCKEIAEGRSVDLIEVDAASRTGVDDMRDLLDNVQYMPSSSRYKVYLIDEVHMLSKSSFNAMLKTLEEPPAHVKFLFATTDPKKLPITVLSRCLQFNLKNMSPEQVVHYLQSVLQQEGIPFDDAALWQLGRAADGSMRDALSLTDQAISYGDSAVTDASVKSMLGSIDQQEVYGLLDSLIAKDADQLLASVAAMASFAPDYVALLDDLLSVLHRVAIAQLAPGAIDNSQGDKALIQAAAEMISKEDVQLLYQIGVNGQKDLPFAPEERSGFEMTLLRMLAFTPLELSQATAADPGSNGGGQAPVKPGSSPLAAILSSLQQDAATDENPKSIPSAESVAQMEEASPVASPTVASTSSAIPESVRDALSASNTTAPDSTSVSDTKVASGQPTMNAGSDAPSVSGSIPGPIREALEASAEAPTAGVDNAEVPRKETTQATQAIPLPEAGGAEGTHGKAEVNTVPQAQPSETNGTPSVAMPAAVREAVSQVSEVPDTNIQIVVKPREEKAPEYVETMDISEMSWSDILDDLRLSGVTHTLAANCSLAERQPGSIKLLLNEGHASLWNRTHENRIAKALTALSGQVTELSIEIGLIDEETPAKRRQRLKEESQARAVDVMQNDSVIRTLIESFNGKLDQQSIKPVQSGDPS
jgi:DNA polymerase III subunit gamma/tau